MSNLNDLGIFSFMILSPITIIFILDLIGTFFPKDNTLSIPLSIEKFPKTAILKPSKN